MCAIAGIITNRSGVSLEELTRTVTEMLTLMAHRGPDATGIVTSEESLVCFGHKRLAIVDLGSRADQPQKSDCKASLLIFNGEIYNFKELRKSLRAKGIDFKTESDTEVLLKGLIEEGEQFLRKIDGMYAFGFWNQSTKTLLLGRDPFGEKPLYYTITSNFFAFASELKALRSVPGFRGEISTDDIATFLSFQKISAPGTIYKNCSQLPPGHLLRLSGEGDVEISRIFNFNPIINQSTHRDLRSYTDELEALMVRVIKRRLIADVPIGVFLSSGIDSSTTAAIAAKHTNKTLQSFSVGFTGDPSSEHEEATSIAKHIGTKHHVEMVNPQDFIVIGEQIAKSIDEPNGDSSCIPTYIISQVARNAVKVVLTGDGGDELFFGYNRFFSAVNECFHDRVFAEVARESDNSYDYYTHKERLVFGEGLINEFLGYIPKGYNRLLAEKRNNFHQGSMPFYDRLRIADVSEYLPVVLDKVDRMSMLHSLECRTPYLSPEVVNFAEHLPRKFLYDGKRGKLVLRSLGERYLPEHITKRQKYGFSLSGVNHELTADIIRVLKDRFSCRNSVIFNWFDPKLANEFLNHKLERTGFYTSWTLLTLTLWLESNA